MEANLTPSQQTKKCILYIDDNHEMFSAMELIFSRLGYDVVITAWGSEALRLLAARPENFDLIITDFHLININGLELSKQLLNINPDIPIILCSGNMKLDKDEMRDIGIRELLFKPFSVQDLAKVIQKVLPEKEIQSYS